MAKPIEGTYPVFFNNYIQQVPEETIQEAFIAQQKFVDNYFADLPADKIDYAYAPGKWTIKLLMQHIIDTERIFNYRALCIARKETQSLPGFAEDDYAANSEADHRSWASLVEELQMVRQSTILLYTTLPPGALQNLGTSNGKQISVHALAFTTIGHIYHHINVINQRYLG